jgi:hypothetical protein
VFERIAARTPGVGRILQDARNRPVYGPLLFGQGASDRPGPQTAARPPQWASR